jgi:vancomycin permeability regulator SanA
MSTALWHDKGRRRLIVLAVLAGLVAAGIAGPSVWTRVSTDERRYADAAAVPETPVALVLGARVHPSGRPSALLARRLDLAAELVRRGTVRVVLVSGDNGDRRYDEVTAMADYLVRRGVPARQVVRDHAGFDTWDSCTRAHRIFGVDRAVVVTQAFHLPRAVALCRRAGIEATGLGDDSGRDHPGATRAAATREVLATIKAAWSALVRPDPRLLGRPEPGVRDALTTDQ